MPLGTGIAQVKNPDTGKPYLIHSGEARAVIVSPKKPRPKTAAAIEELQYHLQRASGTRLETLDPEQAAALPADRARVRFSQDKKLPVETFQIKSSGNTLLFTGDGRGNDTLQWAVDYFLDRKLGVRWLWPGEVGTYVPKHATIPLPQLDHTGRPLLEKRQLRTPLKRRSHENSPTLLTKEQYRRVMAEANDWLKRFQSGSRSHYDFGHAFTHWWDKYGESHPDYFAFPPEGGKYKQPWPKPRRVKLNLGNEAIDEAIIAEWKAAGAPGNWNVCPNDSTGFGTSDATRAMDDPPNQDPLLIWRTATAKLTARYVNFWNRLIVKMRETNPGVTLSSYAYSAYRDPPPNGLALQNGIVLGLVPSYWAQDHWRQWQEAGADLFLRPNWWHTGGVAPVLPLHQQGNFFKFAQSHNMVGFDSDSLMGYWATQGPMYYVIARLMVHPEMSVDDILKEYCSAFGSAAADIRDYLDYWEDFTHKAAYPVPAGGAVQPQQAGLVGKLVKEHNLSKSPLAQGWQVIPHLYTDEALGEAHALLDQAEKNSASDGPYVEKRIQFLRNGLDHLKLTRDVLELGYRKKRSPGEQEKFEALSLKLQEMRKRMTPDHVIWGESLNATDSRRRVPTMTSGVKGKPEDLRGM